MNTAALYPHSKLPNALAGNAREKVPTKNNYPCGYCHAPNRTPGWRSWHEKHKHGPLVGYGTFSRAGAREERSLEDYRRSWGPYARSTA